MTNNQGMFLSFLVITIHCGLLYISSEVMIQLGMLKDLAISIFVSLTLVALVYPVFIKNYIDKKVDTKNGFGYCSKKHKK